MSLISSPPWHYWRTHHPFIHEMSLGQGSMLALPLHFHTEDQISFVITGCRSFQFAHCCTHVPTGHAIIIPKGIPHTSRDTGAETLCLNLYATAHTYQDPYDIEAMLSDLVNIRPLSVISLPTARLHPLSALITGSVSVQALAQQHCMSREGFSRRFRRYYGLSPQNAHLLNKLNTAKKLLRCGYTLADTAYTAGFSDQSHLGRLFRRAFGTTPRRYQVGAQNHLIQL